MEMNLGVVGVIETEVILGVIIDLVSIIILQYCKNINNNSIIILQYCKDINNNSSFHLKFCEK